MDDLLYAVAFSVMGISAQREAGISTESLCSKYESLTSESRRTAAHILKVYGCDPLQAAGKILKECERGGFIPLTRSDPDYPPLLAEITDAPVVLYMKGYIPKRASVSIVGTRGSDKESEAAARKIALESVKSGLCVVSGIAAGIDRFAHIGALDAGGYTVAVLPNGIDMKAPVMNRDVFHLIESSRTSAVVSEYPPGIQAERWTFVRRNRIISGFSRATVVVKAGIKSGAMITARYALDQGRDVFACGGMPFNEGYLGCQNLIRDGALIVSDLSDIARSAGVEAEQAGLFEETCPPKETLFAYQNGSTEEKMICRLKTGPEDIDTLIRELNLVPAEAARAAMCLEIAGVVTRHGARIALA